MQSLSVPSIETRKAMKCIVSVVGENHRLGRKRCPWAALAALLLLALGRAGLAAGLPPASGLIVPELQPLEQAMTNFMAGFQYSAGTLALMKDSKLVLR